MKNYYLESLQHSIAAKLNQEDEIHNKQEYENALQMVRKYLEESEKNGSKDIHPDNEDFSLIQKVAWSISVSRTVGRDISSNTPGRFVWDLQVD